jgi:hypothetical protein
MYSFSITSGLCMKNNIIQLSSISLLTGRSSVEKINNNCLSAFWQVSRGHLKLTWTFEFVELVFSNFLLADVSIRHWE